jgi:signal peptidase
VKALKLTVYGLLATLVLAAVAVALIGWHQGYRAYAVQTGSMTPTYPTGALVIDRPADGRLPAIGDVITMQTANGLFTHRVHGFTPDGIQTKGDANKTPDAWATKPEHVVGVVSWGAAYLGYVFVFFQQPTGAPALVLIGLSVWFAWSLFFPSPEPSGELSDEVPDETEVDLVDLRDPADDETPPGLILLPGADSSASSGGTTVLPGHRRSRAGLLSA